MLSLLRTFVNWLNKAQVITFEQYTLPTDRPDRNNNIIDFHLGRVQKLRTRIEEVQRKVNEQRTRLCPLGWTAIGWIAEDNTGREHHPG